MSYWFEHLSEPVQEVVRAGLEIVADFDAYGEVLQVSDDGEYGQESAIEKLRTALHNLAG